MQQSHLQLQAYMIKIRWRLLHVHWPRAQALQQATTRMLGSLHSSRGSIRVRERGATTKLWFYCFSGRLGRSLLKTCAFLAAALRSAKFPPQSSLDPRPFLRGQKGLRVALPWIRCTRWFRTRFVKLFNNSMQWSSDVNLLWAKHEIHYRAIYIWILFPKEPPTTILSLYNNIAMSGNHSAYLKRHNSEWE